jgi:endonuclease-8
VPEGHTLYRLARARRLTFRGRAVHVTSPQGRFAAGAALLDGRVLQEVFSYGKHLFADFGGDTLHVHLGLYGTFIGGTGDPPPPKGALRMRWVADGPDGSGVWADLRGPTTCEVLAGPEVAAILARLGPDPLRPRADGAPAHRRIAASRTAIGALLMDQSVLAGVGNVYRAELLFRHQISPFRVGRAVDAALWQSMWADLVTSCGRACAWVASSPRGPRTGPGAAGRCRARTRTTSIGARGCRAASAARGSAPRSWSGATSTGARPARPSDRAAARGKCTDGDDRALSASPPAVSAVRRHLHAAQRVYVRRR